MPLPEGSITVEASLFPEQLAAGEKATVTVVVHNHTDKDIADVKLRNALPAGLSFVAPSANNDRAGGGLTAPVTVEPATNDLVADVPFVRANDTQTLTYVIQAAAPAGGNAVAITDVLQVSAAGMDIPAAAEINLVVLPAGERAVSVEPGQASQMDASHVELNIPAGAAGVEPGVVVVKESAPQQSSGLMTQFDLTLLTDPGSKREPLDEAISSMAGEATSVPESVDTATPEPTSEATTLPLEGTPATEATQTEAPPEARVGISATEIVTQEASAAPSETSEPPSATPTSEASATPTSEATSTGTPETPTPQVATETPTPVSTLNPERPDLAISDRLDEEHDLVPQEAHFPYTMTVDLTGLVKLSKLPADREPFVAVYDPQNRIWIRQPIKEINRAANTVTVETNHFSTWGAGIGGTFPTNGASIPLYDEARVATFTGKSSYSYPLWLPSGRAGMTPSLALSYASGSVDGILGDVQAPIAGMGWNVDSAEITRKIMNGGCGTGCGSGVYGYTNEFVLAFNGTSYKLFPDGATGRYRTEDESFLYIQRHNDALGNASDTTTNPSASPINDTHEWWEVVTTDGTRYRLGWNTDSEQLAPMPGYTSALSGAWAALGYAGIAADRVALRWRVDLVTDVHNNSMIYTYAEDHHVVEGKAVNYDTASYPATIRYTGISTSNNGLCDPASAGCTEVRFVTATRSTGFDLPASPNAWDTWDQKYLTSVEVHALQGATDTLLRTYNLNISDFQRQDHDGDPTTWDSLILNSITTVGGNGGSTLTVPKISFEYANFDNRAAQSGQSEWGYPRMVAIHNGTGGQVVFSYINDARPATQSYAWRVNWREVSDGVTTDKRRTEYLYGTPCYDDSSDPTNGWCNSAKNGSLVGHDWSTETVENFTSGVLSTVKHYFLTDKPRTGREWQTDTMSANGTIYFRTQNDYTTVDNTTNTNYPTGVRFVTNSETRSYERQGGSLNLVTTTTSTYDATTGDLLTTTHKDHTGTTLTQDAYTYLRNAPDVYLSADFNTNENGFTYQDDTFRSTNSPAYAAGVRVTTGGYNNGGALQVTLGGVDNTTVNGISGGWSKSFTLSSATHVTLSLRYNLNVATAYSSSQFGEALVSVDGVLYGIPSHDYMAHIADGGTSGWTIFTRNLSLAAGTHTVIIGGYNNQKTASTQTTVVTIDDVQVARSDATTNLSGFTRSKTTTDGSSNVIAQSFSAYDSTAAGLGTVGDLTLSQTRTLADSTQTMDTSYSYDTYGNQTGTRAYGNYGTLGTLPTADNNVDRTTSTVYDSTYNAYPVSVTNPLNRTSSTQYDFQRTGELPLGLPRTVTDPNNVTSETVYDLLGRTIATKLPGGPTDGNVKILYPALNGSGEIAAPYTIELQIWDDGGPGGAQYRHAWAFYDGLGRILRTIGPAEGASQYIQADTYYNALGLTGKSARPYQVTIGSPPGSYSPPNWSTLKVTTMTYDGFGRAIQVTAPDGSTARTAYDGRSTTVIDPNSHQKQSTVDDFGRLVAVKEYSGTGAPTDPFTLYTTTSYTYDARSLLTNVTDAQGNQTVLGYDTLGRKTSMSDPDMGSWSYAYTLWGELSLQTDARGAQIQFSYDKLSRPTLRQARDNSGQSWSTVASYGYDSTSGGNMGIGRLTSDSSTAATDTMTYNALGQLTSTTRTIDGVQYTTGMTYDSLGRVLTTTLPTGETVATTYDERGLFKSLTGTDAYVSSTDYTPSGNVDTQVLGNGVINDFSYDPNSDRLSRIQTGKPSDPALVDLGYSYDPAGNITGVVDGTRLEDRQYEYDFLDRLTYAGVFTSQDVMVEQRLYGYDTIGNLLSTRLTYQSASLGKGAFHVGSNGSSPNFQSTYNFNSLSGLGLASSNYKANGDSPYIVGAFGPPANGQHGFATGSLQSGTKASSANFQSFLSFNGMSGFTSSSGQQVRGVTPFVRGFNGAIGSGYGGPYSETAINYTYPSNHVRPHAVSSRSNGDSFTYDANGNMTQRVQNGVTWNQVFDAENHLVTVSGGGTITTYVYDSEGNRVKQIVTNGSTTVTTIYVMSMEIEMHGSTEDHRTIYYAAGGAFRVIGGANAGLYFRHTDNLGSTSLISDASGNKVPNSDVVFAPYGEIRAGQLSTLTDFGYTGQRLDRSSGGLMYYGARYYLPGLDRFISPDSMVPGTSDPQTLNRFSYGLNNPVKYSDPFGHKSCDVSESGGCYSTGNYVNDLNKDLGSYGVKVNFEHGTNLTDQVAALSQTRDAVHTVADRTKRAIDSINADRASKGQTQFLNGSVSSANAFKAVFGPTQFNVQKGLLCCTPSGAHYYGENPAGKTNGVNVVSMAMGGFFDTLNGGAARSGPLWVAHEIGHSLEHDYGVTSYNDTPIRDLIIPQSGDWSTSSGELTPDIIAAWAYDTYQPGATAAAFQQNVNTWMSNLITGILSAP